MYLFFDTETTGTPKDYNSHPKRYLLWPNLVQLGYVLYDENREVIEEGNYIIKPEGFEIPKGASDIHGITTQMAIEKGMPLSFVIDKFFDALDRSKYIICHNLNFDYKVILSEYYRLGMSRMSTPKIKICTMLSTVEYCAIPNKYPKYGNFKWPKLMELHEKLFGCGFEDAHDAVADIKATAKCFWELIDNDVISIENDEKIIMR